MAAPAAERSSADAKAACASWTSEAWSEFDLIQCITLRERPERRAAAERQFELIGLKDRVEFLLQDRDVEDGKRGCFHAHQQAASIALERGAQRALTFEDDVIFLESLPMVPNESIMPSPIIRLRLGRSAL